MAGPPLWPHSMSTAQSSALLLALLLLFAMHVTSSNADRLHVHKKATAANSDGTDADFIAASCKATTFRRLCVDSLSPYRDAIRDSRLQLARAAVSVSLARARSASAAVATLAADGSLTKREAAAARDCVTTVGDSVDQLQRSVDAIGRAGGRKGSPPGLWRVDDIQTWVSAALTDEDTCMDGFPERGMNGAVKLAVRWQIVEVAQLTSNALALINALKI